METSSGAGVVAAVTFTAGGLHLQILSATPEEEMKMSLHSAAYSSAGEDEQAAAKWPLFVGKNVKRGLFNTADKSQYLNGDEFDSAVAAAAEAAACESHNQTNTPVCFQLHYKKNGMTAQLQENIDSVQFGTLILTVGRTARGCRRREDD